MTCNFSFYYGPAKSHNLIQSKLLIWVREFVKLLPNIAIASLILVLGIYLANCLKIFLPKIFHRFTHHDALTNLFSSFIYILGIGVSIFAALTVLHFDKAVTSILAGAGIAGIALAFAFQEQIVIVPNKEIFQNSLENFSRSGKRRLDLTVGVSYGEDLERVRQITLQAVKAVSVLALTNRPGYSMTNLPTAPSTFLYSFG